MKNIEKRLAYIEQALKSKETLQRPDIPLDQIIQKLGFDPALVRQEAKENNSSIAEVTCRHLGMEVREFMRLLKERVSLHS